MDAPIIRFGRYKGTPLDQVPLDYLEWAVRKRCLKGASKRLAKQLLGMPLPKEKLPSAGPFGPSISPSPDCPFECPEDEEEKKFIQMVKGF